MGEYAKRKSDGEEIKIGTCEDMMYLRFEDRSKVAKIPNSLDPSDESIVTQLRFRFPIPWEDGKRPGDYDGPTRGITLMGVSAPDGVEHSTRQLRSDNGYLLSIPCPESKEGAEKLAKAGLTVGKNGWNGDLKIVAQRKLSPTGPLVLICECGGCGALFNLPTKEDVAPIVEVCLKEAERCTQGPEYQRDPKRAKDWITIADRILAGYR